MSQQSTLCADCADRTASQAEARNLMHGSPIRATRPEALACFNIAVIGSRAPYTAMGFWATIARVSYSCISLFLSHVIMDA